MLVDRKVLRAAVSALVLIAATWPQVSEAHPSPDVYEDGWSISMEQLFAFVRSAEAKEFSGPTEPIGIGVKDLGLVELGPEVEGLEGRQMRARYWTMEPGGIVPVHSHADRPAQIYVVKGTVAEHRSDSDEPHIYQAGDLSVENNGVVHWWENGGDTVVELLAIDIFNTNP